MRIVIGDEDKMGLESKSHLNKAKLVKWIEEEIYGCEFRREYERANALRELLLKIERGYFDK